MEERKIGNSSTVQINCNINLKAMEHDTTVPGMSDPSYAVDIVAPVSSRIASISNHHPGPPPDGGPTVWLCGKSDSRYDFRLNLELIPYRKFWGRSSQ